MRVLHSPRLNWTVRWIWNRGFNQVDYWLLSPGLLKRIMPPIIIPLIPRVTPVAVIQLKREGETVRFWSNAEVIITQKKNFNFCSRFLWSARWLPPHLVQFAGPGLDSTWVSYCLLQADHAHKGRVQKPSHGIRAESPRASTDEIFPQQKLTDGKAILLNGGFCCRKLGNWGFGTLPYCSVLSFNMLQHQLDNSCHHQQ